MLLPVAIHNRFAERLHPHNVALILIDCQERLITRTAEKPAAFRNNVLGLAQVACAYQIPVLAATYAASRHGRLLSELASLFPAQQVVERPKTGLWDDETLQQKIHDLGRRDLIIAGVAHDDEFVNLALAAQRHGYRVHVAADASAGGDLFTQRVAVAAMSASGVQLTNWVAVMAELTASGGALVSSAWAAVTKHLSHYSTTAIRWGGDEGHLVSAEARA